MAGKVNEITDSNFEQTVLQSDKPTLVDFWAPWCGPCLALAPVIEEIANEYSDKVKVCKINVDDSPETAAKYGIRGIPTIILFNTKGEVLNQMTGAVPKQNFVNMISNLKS